MDMASAVVKPVTVNRKREIDLESWPKAVERLAFFAELEFSVVNLEGVGLGVDLCQQSLTVDLHPAVHDTIG